MHFTYFAYETHADIKSSSIWITDETGDVSDNKGARGWLSERSGTDAEIAFVHAGPEIVRLQRRNAFAVARFACAMRLAQYNYEAPSKLRTHYGISG